MLISHLYEPWYTSCTFMLSCLCTDFVQFNLDLFQPLSCEVETARHSKVGFCHCWGLISQSLFEFLLFLVFMSVLSRVSNHVVIILFVAMSARVRLVSVIAIVIVISFVHVCIFQTVYNTDVVRLFFDIPKCSDCMTLFVCFTLFVLNRRRCSNIPHRWTLLQVQFR